jgi:hypothetical protein
MQTQLTCPQCQIPFTAEIHQVVDVGRNPQLKRQLLSGGLNVAMCPSCGFAAQLGTPMLYHDPNHELFMVFVPMELNLPHVEQQKIIGDLVQQAMSAIPQEQRRGYMLQPTTMLSYQSFLEKVLETEGITPEMLARQRKQAELLETMSRADRDVIDILLQERADEIDETFFALLASMLQAAAETDNDEQALKLSNLQARLYQETELGKQLERRQVALHALRREANAQGGLTPEILLKHLLRHEEDEPLVDAIVNAGQGVLSYELFSQMADEIELREKAGDEVGASRLDKIRKSMLALHDEMQQASRQALAQASQLLQQLLSAEDTRAAVRDHMDEIDDAFMYLLSATLSQAQEGGAEKQADALQELRDVILDEADQQTPPEIRFLNRLMLAETDESRRQLLEDNREMVTPELVQVLRLLVAQADQAGDEEAKEAIQALQAFVEEAV